MKRWLHQTVENITVSASAVCMASTTVGTVSTVGLFVLSPFVSDSTEQEIKNTILWSIPGLIGGAVLGGASVATMKALEDNVPDALLDLEPMPTPTTNRSLCHGCKFYSSDAAAVLNLAHPCAVHPDGMPDPYCPDFSPNWKA